MLLLTSAAAVAAAGGWAWTAHSLHRRVTAVGELQRDGLTGLWRREGFEYRAPAALAAGNAVLLLDLDGFKQINDTHGHAAGDLVLRAVAERPTAELGDTALCARLGGDEFAAIAQLDFPAPGAQLNHLTTALTAPTTSAGEQDSGAVQVAAGVSVGVAWVCDLPAFDLPGADRISRRSSGGFWPAVLSEALAAADAAMYAAKAHEDGWRLFDRDSATEQARPATRICRSPVRRLREHGPAAVQDHPASYPASRLASRPAGQCCSHRPARHTAGVGAVSKEDL